VPVVPDSELSALPAFECPAASDSFDRHVLCAVNDVHSQIAPRVTTVICCVKLILMSLKID
jgi:predicted 2-oxoglutarate/Fe(II)-dependent dioxygenase YbiX